METAPISIGLKWLENGIGLPVPSRHSNLAAGVDLMAAIEADSPITIPSGQRAMVPCGFSLALPPGYEAQVRPRSGLAAKHGVTVLNAPGTIDADYRGEIKVVLINHGETDFSVWRGDRIAQMVVAPVSVAWFRIETSHDDTGRGEGGFGSTGISG
jgi:dUTP pyrophosphatase